VVFVLHLQHLQLLQLLWLQGSFDATG
jgi:hypothetical protein